MPESITISIQVSVNAPVSLVWDCWTKDEHIVNWNFAGHDWHCPKAVTDLKEGGKFNWTMAAKDESFTFDFEGEFTKISAPDTLEYTLLDGRKVKLKFSLVNSSTLVQEEFEAESENPVEMQQQGWQMILNNFKAYVEGLKI